MRRLAPSEVQLALMSAFFFYVVMLGNWVRLRNKLCRAIILMLQRAPELRFGAYPDVASPDASVFCQTMVALPDHMFHR